MDNRTIEEFAVNVVKENMEPKNINEEYYLLYTSSPTELYESDNNEFALDDYSFDELPLPDDIEIVEFNIYGKDKDAVRDFDIHTDGSAYVISDKVQGALAAFDIPTIQMVPVLLKFKKKDPIEGFWYLNMYALINCLDKANSKYTGDESLGTLGIVEKLSLDAGGLSAIPLQQRLVFSLGEMFTHRLFHQSVVDAVMATDPQGIRFVRVSDFGPGVAFD